MKLPKIYSMPHFLSAMALLLFISVYFLTHSDKKYFIYSQGKTYNVDNFRIMGGQVIIEEDEKRVIIKGNYIIEINETK